jgi:hypothetical protein
MLTLACVMVGAEGAVGIDIVAVAAGLDPDALFATTDTE